MVYHSPNSIAKPPNQPYTSARAASTRHCNPPFPLAPIYRAQLPRQQEPGNYPTPAIGPDEEDDGQLRTENLASKSMEPASDRSCLRSV